MREVNNGPGCLRGPCRIDGFLKECEFNFLYRATEERVKAILEALGNKESRLVAGPQERPVPILHRGLTEPGDLPLCFPSVTSSRSLTARIFLAASALLAFASEVVFNPRVLDRSCNKFLVNLPDPRLEFLRGDRAVPAQFLNASLAGAFRAGSRQSAFSAERAGLRRDSRPA